MALNVGSRLGHYDVTALIGEGGVKLLLRQQVSVAICLKVVWPTDLPPATSYEEPTSSQVARSMGDQDFPLEPRVSHRQ